MAHSPIIVLSLACVVDDPARERVVCGHLAVVGSEPRIEVMAALALAPSDDVGYPTVNSNTP